MFDDVSNIVNATGVHMSSFTKSEIMEAWNAGFAGPSGRPVAIFSFALNHYFSGGLDPLSYKWVNIAIHILNSLLVYLFLKSLLKYASKSSFSKVRAHSESNMLPALVALIWAIHPVQLSSILYVVQRMTLLSATFTLVSMLIYLWLRGEHRRLDISKTLAGMMLLLITVILGFYSKENAVLVVLFILLIELYLFQFKCSSLSSQFCLYSIQVFGVFLPILLALGFLFLNPGWVLAGYEYRDFDLSERLMTQARMVWTYFYWVINPDISNYALFHDDVSISRSLIDPKTTLLSLAAFMVLVLSVMFYWKKLGLIGFGIIFFLLAHILESTVLALEMVFEHRNYLASVGLLLAIFLFFEYLIQSHCRTIRKSFKQAGLVLLYFLVASSTYIRAATWGDELLRSKAAVENHPDSARSQYSYAVKLSEILDPEIHYDDLSYHFSKAVELNPRSVEFLQGSMVFDLSAGRNIDENFYGRMNLLLATKPPHKTDIIRVDELITMCVQGLCEPNFDSGALYTFIKNGLNNPRNNKGAKYLWDIVLARFHWQLAGEPLIAESLLESVLDIAPNQIVANAYLLDLRMERSDKEVRESMLIKFEESNLGRRHPSIVAQLRAKYD